MIAVEIPLIITKIIANLVLFFTVYLVWLTGKTPSYSAVAFFIFNISGLLFVAIGFKENIMEMARSGAFIIFVSYVSYIGGFYSCNFHIKLFIHNITFLEYYISLI